MMGLAGSGSVNKDFKEILSQASSILKERGISGNIELLKQEKVVKKSYCYR
jgi:hypothetical protein